MGSAARKDVVIRLRVARDQKCALFEAARRRGTTSFGFPSADGCESGRRGLTGRWSGPAPCICSWASNEPHAQPVNEALAQWCAVQIGMSRGFQAPYVTLGVYQARISSR